MSIDIYSSSNYRDYLLAWIASQPKRGHGARAAMAVAMGSPVSHISQVLKGISNLSMEQAEDLNDFLGHGQVQSAYFLLLVQEARAGTPRLRKRLAEQLQKLREEQLVLKNRLDTKKALSEEHQALFYSSWLYAAIHIVLTIPTYQTAETVAQYFRLPLKRCRDMLDFLESIGMVKAQDGRYVVGETRVHLPHDSPMIGKHHANWRLQALQSLERDSDVESLHYSSVVSIAKDDIPKIKLVLIKAIENAKGLIRDSKEEELHSFCMDFFKV